jgi:hypothetical protein
MTNPFKRKKREPSWEEIRARSTYVGSAEVAGPTLHPHWTREEARAALDRSRRARANGAPPN